MRIASAVVVVLALLVCSGCITRLSSAGAQVRNFTSSAFLVRSNCRFLSVVESPEGAEGADYRRAINTIRNQIAELADTFWSVDRLLP